MVTAQTSSKQIVARVLLAAAVLCGPAWGQLLHEPALPTRHQKHKQERALDLEWMWQYGPPPAGGREHEFIQDPHFQPFLERNFTAPQSFWGLQPDNIKDPRRKSLPNTIEDFLAVPGIVMADDNRYITVTGAVFHFPSSRGLLFADLDNSQPLLAFAAIDWIRNAHTTDESNAQYTLWIFTNRQPGTPEALDLPQPLLRSLVRWMKTPLAGSGIVQNIRATILVGADGIPHQVATPTAGYASVPPNSGVQASLQQPRILQ